MKYYIGLDMGTSSLGWAVTDEKYKLVRKKGKDMWGVRLFDEADTAAARRTYRVAKRRRNREKARIGYVKELFAPEIEKKDAGFFQRLDDSKFYAEDKIVKQKFALFADTGYTDVEYYTEYPTIFHLRKKLIESKEPQDIRLVYLAILNIFKHRGHFLNTNLSEDGNMNFKELYADFVKKAETVVGVEFLQDISDNYLQDILSSNEYSKSDKVSRIIEHYGIKKSAEKQKVEMLKLICGLKGTLSKIFEEEEWEEEDKKFSISYRDGNYDETCQKVEEVLSESSYELFCTMKQLHDWSLLANIMKGENGEFEYLSLARVAAYEKHQRDLKILKKLYKENSVEKYNKMFRIMEKNNYSAYVGSVNSDKVKSDEYKNGKRRRGVQCSREDFVKAIKKDIEEFPESEEKKYVIEEIDKENFLPKQLTASNGVIPNQIHKKELKKILKNAENYLSFLKEKDESDLTVSERIVKMFEFQIPYYIGPISPIVNGDMKYSKNVWSVRKEAGKVYPWNFEQKIDEEESAEKFIARMVKRCTYMGGENVLPKNSLLYEKYMVLNELNNLRINGEKISVKLKQEIFEHLLKTEKKVTSAKLIQFLRLNKTIGAQDIPEISGIDGGFTNKRANYYKFCKIFAVESLTYEQEKMIEQIIFWATVYGDTKKFLKRKIQENYGNELTEKQIAQITGFKFKDWGRLSKALLNVEGLDKTTGEVATVIQKMWNDNYNLMELIESGNFTYKEEIQKKGKVIDKTLSEIVYEDLDDLYISAPVRRMTWQTILVLKEITNIMGEPPACIFVEMARDPNAEKKRTISRKKKFEALYKNCKEERELYNQIQNKWDESDFRRKKLYLYYTQKGRCMYSGERIDLDDLFNDNLYDIDHIYPRHFVKDDSIDNNLVLVKKQINAHKSDGYPIQNDIQDKCRALWKELQKGGFINDEKYKRLTRTYGFSEDEKVSFINRQLVETRQGTKAITDLFTKTFPQADIVYVKAPNVSEFRKKYELLKCRNVNDFHHAKDAYLNIVVGNVYHVKFTKNPYNFMKEYERAPEKNPYHMDKIFNYPVIRNGEVAWQTKKDESITMVKQMMRKNTPLVTRRNYEAHGGLADQTIYSAKDAKKAAGVGYVGVKTSDERLCDTTKYGGFKKMTGAYFCLVEHTKKNKRIRTIEAVPLYLKHQLNVKEKLEQYFAQTYGYENPDVRLEKIKMYSLIKVNGFYMYLTGRTGNQLLVCNAVQMILPQKWELYIKEMTKAYSAQFTEDYMEKQGLLCMTDNIKLYDLLCEKHLQGIYNLRPNPVGDKLVMGREKFVELSISEQIYVLLQILQLSQLINQGADLCMIGGAKKTGVTLTNKIVSDCREFKLINQSITGLYENEIDLLTV